MNIESLGPTLGLVKKDTQKNTQIFAFLLQKIGISDIATQNE